MTASSRAVPDPATDASERLSLADWRRRVGDLYASIRAISVTDPRAAWQLWHSTRDDLFRTHPQSPVPPAKRAAFRGRYWPYDPGLRFLVAVNAMSALDRPEPGGPANLQGLGIELPMSSGDAMTFTQIGDVTVPFPSGPRTLGLFWMAGYAGGLFLPFRDASNGLQTYGAGRYLLDGAKSADLGTDASGTRLILDFNFAFQPSCAFDPRWSCPLAPPGNRLDIAVEAGERLT